MAGGDAGAACKQRERLPLRSDSTFTNEKGRAMPGRSI